MVPISLTFPMLQQYLQIPELWLHFCPIPLSVDECWFGVLYTAFVHQSLLYCFHWKYIDGGKWLIGHVIFNKVKNNLVFRSCIELRKKWTNRWNSCKRRHLYIYIHTQADHLPPCTPICSASLIYKHLQSACIHTNPLSTPQYAIWHYQYVLHFFQSSHI